MLVNLWRIYSNSARKCHAMGDFSFWMFTEIRVALPNHVCKQTDSCPPSWGLLKGMYPEWTSPQVTAEPHRCPGAWHLSCSSQLLQPCRRNPPPAPALARLSGLTPTLLVTAAADLDYLEKTGAKPHKHGMSRGRRHLSLVELESECLMVVLEESRPSPLTWEAGCPLSRMGTQHLLRDRWFEFMSGGGEAWKH